MAKNNIYDVTIDDGVKEIQLKNTYGQLICKIHFRPADFSIVDRYKDFIARMQDIVKPLENIEITNTGEAAFEEGWSIIKQAEAEVIDGFNQLFDMDDAQEIFAKRNAFSAVGGSFFCEKVLAALGDVITDAINEETAKSKKKVEKYTS